MSARGLARALAVALACALVTILLLAYLNNVLSTGWKLYVAERGLRAAFAATMAVLVGAAAALVPEALALERRREGMIRSTGFGITRVVITLVTTLATLAYFMPDWTLLSIAAGVVVIGLWMVTFVAAMVMRA